MHVHVRVSCAACVRAWRARSWFPHRGRREQKEDRELDLFGAISLCRASPSAWMR